jgi:hypothetical protein
MPNLLTLKKLTGIHFVDKGAAIKPSVLVIKRIKERATMSLKEKIAKAFNTALENVIKEDPNINKEDPKALLEAALADLPEDKRAAIMAAVGALHQATPPAPTPIEPKQDEPPKPTEPEKQDGDKEDEEMEKLLKNLKPELRALVEPIMKANESLQKRLDETEGKLAEQVAKAEVKAELEAIEKNTAMVPGDIAKRAALLVSIKKEFGQEAHDEVLRSFTAANELIDKGRFSAPGSAHPELGPESAIAKLEAMAKDLIAKSKDPMDQTTAYAIVAKKNRELYNQAEAERVGLAH